LEKKMKLDITQVFRTLEGVPIAEKKDKKSKAVPLTLKNILLASVLGQCAGDELPESSVFRVQRFELSKKLNRAKKDFISVDLKEMAQLKKAIETRVPALLPLMHGQAIAMVEGNDTGLEPKK
jgi:hypothetical protein